MNHLIGLNIEDAKEELNKKGIAYIVVNNNHNVDGDIYLVTNVTQLEDKTMVLTIGSFIFNLKDYCNV